MSAKTSIEWTDATWNPTRGCSRISPGCVNCYAERIVCANRTCSREFKVSTARAFYGRGPLILLSKFCCTECREVARIGRVAYEIRLAEQGS